VIHEVQASSRAAGLKLIDQVNRHPETLEQAPHGAAVGSAPQGDGVDVAAGEKPRKTRL